MHFEQRLFGDRQYYVNRVQGYMTVEATLIMFMVIMIYVFLIRSFFWIYDRCTLEQDMASIVLRCANIDEDKLEQTWQQEVGKLDTEKYLCLRLQAPLLKKQGWKLVVVGSGVDKSFGNCEVSYKLWCLTPTDWLRTMRKSEQLEGIKRGETEE
ncbi:MAG: hypothetical protein IJX63_06260 [Lachnospiraceae bacterium]|nr:hypothetical protein [Lachnospiraceae bacterium]